MSTSGGPKGAKDLDIADLLDRGPWWKNGRLWSLNLWLLLLLLTSYANGYDGAMMNNLQVLDQWRVTMGDPSKEKLGILTAIRNIGLLAGTPFTPYVMDGFGRRVAIALGAFLMISGTAIQSASFSASMFMGARFLFGFGLAFATSASPLLIAELAYPSHRGPIVSAYNSLWYSGAIVAAWTTFGTFRIPTQWAWRIPSILQGAPSILHVTLIWLCPESPRWLLSKGKDAAALRILAFYHGRGDEKNPLVRYEHSEIKKAIERDRKVAETVGWRTLLATPGNRRRMRMIIALAFFSQWSGNGLVTYYLNLVFDTIGITSTTTQTLINGVLQIFNLSICLLASALVDKAGRRVLFLTSSGGMLLFFSLLTVCSARYAITGSSAAGDAVIAFIFLFFGTFCLAFTPLTVPYTIEILPYSLRAKGFTVFSFSLALALIFNQFVNPIALPALGWKYYIVYDCFLVFEFAFMYFFCIETKNRTLEQTAALFDGEQAVQDLATSGITAIILPNESREGLDEVEKRGEQSVA
ncbi:hexose transporter [Dacryopinax primogenitus]|uniref:Hexose transporter n=1 Tax=Dacryopinax primogenitus (strain DJM 731) TaxID=1858805 RepID=M5G7U2_DACPD|nr:hexose transporter [Dacryopinax primogenitus]EJU01952.1 hexose transporter [Dacryopinax primogenitus]